MFHGDMWISFLERSRWKPNGYYLEASSKRQQVAEMRWQILSASRSGGNGGARRGKALSRSIARACSTTKVQSETDPAFRERSNQVAASAVKLIRFRT